MQVLGVHVAFHILHALGITAGSHRLWAHKSYHARSPLRLFLMLLSSGTLATIQGANQGSIYHWSRDHRLHHKFSDTPLDPHSMNRGFFFAHIGWLLQKKSPELVKEGEKINMKDLEADWVVSLQRKYNSIFLIAMCWLLPGT